MDKKKDNKTQKNNRELKIVPSDISVSVNSENGKQKEYTYPQDFTSDVIVNETALSTAVDVGVQVRKVWMEKMKERVDDIKGDYYLTEIELNFGIVKFKIKRVPPKKNNNPHA